MLKWTEDDVRASSMMIRNKHARIRLKKRIEKLERVLASCWFSLEHSGLSDGEKARLRWRIRQAMDDSIGEIVA